MTLAQHHLVSSVTVCLLGDDCMASQLTHPFLLLLLLLLFLFSKGEFLFFVFFSFFVHFILDFSKKEYK